LKKKEGVWEKEGVEMIRKQNKERHDQNEKKEHLRKKAHSWIS